jgi:hypothetical protein
MRGRGLPVADHDVRGLPGIDVERDVHRAIAIDERPVAIEVAHRRRDAQALGQLLPGLQRLVRAEDLRVGPWEPRPGRLPVRTHHPDPIRPEPLRDEHQGGGRRRAREHDRVAHTDVVGGTAAKLATPNATSTSPS